MDKSVAVIGGGIAGIEAASALGQLGYNVILFEKESQLGGNVLSWDRLFPTRRPAHEVVSESVAALTTQCAVNTSTTVKSIHKTNNVFSISVDGNKTFDVAAVVLTTGFKLFAAEKKEEYGYGIFENVITSRDLEQQFKNHGKPLMANGNTPKRVAFIHCVGSRDEKVNNAYCSKVCCVTAVKQAIEVKEALPDTEVFNFYMDLRMFGHGYEQLYKQAQVLGVTFVRGRLSETNETSGGSIIVKVEDTLAAKPMRLTVDLVVLMVGITPQPETEDILNSLGLPHNEDGFVEVKDAHTAATKTNTEGVFVAGACIGPTNITDSINSARAAALQVHSYLNHK